MADHSGFKFIAYVLTILWHIYSSLINMRCLSFQIFKVCKTIVNVHICNGQLKIYGPFIFDRTVLHLVTITKWSTIRSNMTGPHIFNFPLHMLTVTIVLQTLNMRKDM